MCAPNQTTHRTIEGVQVLRDHNPSEVECCACVHVGISRPNVFAGRWRDVGWSVRSITPPQSDTQDRGGVVVPLSIALIYVVKNMNNIKPNSKTVFDTRIRQPQVFVDLNTKTRDSLGTRSPFAIQ